MSIAEFIDGMPSFDKRNFSRFQSNHGRYKRIPIYLATTETPSDQVIVNDRENFLLRYVHRQHDKNNGGRKREFVGIAEDDQEPGPSSRKCPRVETVL
ncbi:DET1- and DDB1-associated protein 1, N-terminal [Cinara cedri]|uniref:DET1- and DDB1-associated protein 1 n=1 Tax=Cinara cedri TaxID=506608 RepID=A0A5E4N053_9HEMI|nr:DET1- and DDB1-associated protein 1, N-terminal [Cinara cedri]